MSMIDTSAPEDEELAPIEPAAGETAPEADAEEAQIEARARAMGWHPLEEFRGDPARWTDARTFVEKGERELPVLRDQLRRVTDKLTGTERHLGTMEATIREQKEALVDLRNLARRANEQGYQRALRELKQQQREAVAAGDTEGYDRIEEQIGALETERTTVMAPSAAPEPEPAPAIPPPKDPAIEAFERANRWWNRDAFLSRQMIAKHEAVAAEYPDMDLAEQLDMALQDLKASFPTRFPEETPLPQAAPRAAPQRPRAAPVVAPRSGPPTARNKTGFDLIEDPVERKEAQDAYNRMRRQMPDLTQDEYLAIYMDPHVDLLEVQNRKRANGAAR